MQWGKAVTALLKPLALAGLLSAAATQACAATCSVTAVTLAFGNYDPFRPGPTDTTGNIAVTCNGTAGEAVTYTIVVNAGAGGTFAQRRMIFAAIAALNYNIYSDPARNLVWGDGNAGSLVVSDALRLPAPSVTKNYPVYGRLFGGQNVPVGSYSDSIVVTLNF